MCTESHLTVNEALKFQLKHVVSRLAHCPVPIEWEKKNECGKQSKENQVSSKYSDRLESREEEEEEKEEGGWRKRSLDRLAG